MLKEDDFTIKKAAKKGHNKSLIFEPFLDIHIVIFASFNFCMDIQ